MAPEKDLIRPISISRLTERWNPFEFRIWPMMETPITHEEIRDALKRKVFLSPDAPKKMSQIWDISPREDHISRIAWFVENWSDDYPIEIDFGIPLLARFIFEDGNHRLAAAIYMGRTYIYAICSGAISEIDAVTLK